MVDEICEEASILMKWKYVNGFTLFVMLEQRKKIEPFDGNEIKTMENC